MGQDRIWILTLAAAVGFCLFLVWPGEAKPFFGEGEWLHGSNINLGLDLQGGSELRVTLDRSFLERGTEIAKETDRAIEVLERRINHHGLKEPRIQRIGEDQILIQLPGIDQSEAKRVKDIVTRSGKLEFKIEADEDVVQRSRYPDKAPKGYKWYARGDDSGGGENPVLVKDESKLTGDKVKTATYGLDVNQPGSWEVNLVFNAEGRRLFADMTRKHVQHRIAIILDDKLVSAPVVREPILGGQAQITGGFKSREAADLSTVLRSGSLPAPLRIVAETFVGPSLGEDSIRKGLQAGILAMLAVLVFMGVFYRSLGVAANLALLINVIFLLGALAFAGATLTLPGIAGIVLTLGMAVDSNIIIYERIRDEVEKGKGPLQAFEAGFDRAFWTVFDANVTTFITGLVLYSFGSGAVKGFAVTLMVGIVTTMITALWITRTLLHAMLHTDIPWLKITEFRIARAVGNTNFPFMATAPVAVRFSLAIVVVTMAVFAFRGKDNFGIDFRGGTVVDVSFAEPQKIDDVRRSITTLQVTDAQGTRTKYSDAEVQSISTSVEAATDLPPGTSREFSIRTGVEDANAFRADLAQLFGDRLGATPIDVLGKLEKSGHPYHGGDRLQVNLGKPMPYAEFDKKAKEAFDKAGLPKPIARLIGVTVEPGKEPAEAIKAFELILHPSANDRFKEVKSTLTSTFALSNDPFTRVENIGPTVARTLLTDGLKALIFSWIGIILYLAVRFELMFGIAAVVALIHDVTISIGVTCLVAAVLPSSMGISLDIGLTALASYLALIGYSVNDTIVVFDRVRENMLLGKKASVADVVDRSVNETLSRSLMTAATVFITVLILFIVNARSGSGIAQFAFPMLVGVVVGTYSSVFIACPLVVWVGGKAARTAPASKPEAASASPA